MVNSGKAVYKFDSNLIRNIIYNMNGTYYPTLKVRDDFADIPLVFPTQVNPRREKRCIDESQTIFTLWIVMILPLYSQCSLIIIRRQGKRRKLFLLSTWLPRMPCMLVRELPRISNSMNVHSTEITFIHTGYHHKVIYFLTQALSISTNARMSEFENIPYPEYKVIQVRSRKFTTCMYIAIIKHLPVFPSVGETNYEYLSSHWWVRAWRRVENQGK
jgi:hypothetical protein